jgi:N4-gp56 family major capsid protein
MFTEMVAATTKVSTFPIRPAYIGITHVNVIFTMQEMPGWISVEEYASESKVMDGEVGAYKNTRWIQTTQAKAWLGGGGAASGDVKSTSSNADVYSLLLFGKEAIATVPLEGMSLENIIKPLGSAGVADPLNQLSTSGWKHTGARKILNDNFMTRGEVTVGDANP